MQIRVSPDVLRNVANQQGSISNSFDEAATTIGNLSDQLGDAWEGASGDQARNTLAEIRSGIKNVARGVEKGIQKLTGIADAFENIDSGEGGFTFKFPDGLIPMPIMPRLILSMPGMIRIDPDRVRDVAEQCKTVAASISDNSAAYSDSIKGLSNDWEGKSYVKYEEESQSIVKALQNIDDSMTEFISKIVNAANRYEELDNSL